MWYEILINGFSWFIKDLTFSSNIKIAEKVGGELTEGRYTRQEMSQIRQQVNDYLEYGANKMLSHLNRSGAN